MWDGAQNLEAESVLSALDLVVSCHWESRLQEPQTAGTTAGLQAAGATRI